MAGAEAAERRRLEDRALRAAATRPAGLSRGRATWRANLSSEVSGLGSFLGSEARRAWADALHPPNILSSPLRPSMTLYGPLQPSTTFQPTHLHLTHIPHTIPQYMQCRSPRDRVVYSGSDRTVITPLAQSGGYCCVDQHSGVGLGAAARRRVQPPKSGDCAVK